MTQKPAILALLTLVFLSLACSSRDAANEPSNSGGGASKGACSAEAKSIQQHVFTASCAGTGCHGAEAPAAGLDLVSQDPARLAGTSSALCAGWSLVVPGSPEKSFLYDKLTASTPACGELMPLGAHLSAEETQCVADWIRGMGGGGCETCGSTECVALASDAAHCGSCNNACANGVPCENGACACPSGATACAGQCVDMMTDASHCGACANSCAASSTCIAGACHCAESLTSCAGSCTELASDPAHCGSCNNACQEGEVCLLGQCAAGCGSLTECDGRCVDLKTSVVSCGACGSVCSVGLSCQEGRCSCPGASELCGSTCVDTRSDAANCGGCGQACGAGEACIEGACQCTDSGSVSFAKDVAPILEGACTSAGCHAGVKPKEGLSLDAGRAYAELVNVTASQCGGNRKLVAPGSPSTSYLLQKMLGVEVCSGTQMPKAGQTLPRPQLDVISSWICAGAADN
jgi:Stigma-specific protein, Stig1/Planctomycete cytochrome C